MFAKRTRGAVTPCKSLSPSQASQRPESPPKVLLVSRGIAQSLKADYHCEYSAAGTYTPVETAKVHANVHGAPNNRNSCTDDLWSTDKLQLPSFVVTARDRARVNRNAQSRRPAPRWLRTPNTGSSANTPGPRRNAVLKVSATSRSAQIPLSPSRLDSATAKENQYHEYSRSA